MPTLDLIDGYAALREGVAVCAMPRDVLAVEGADAETYLQGQLSQDVSTLATGDTTWALVLQPQGKVDAWVRIHRTAEDAFLLDVDAGGGDALGARLTRFLLRTKADVRPIDGVSCWAVRGPDTATLVLGTDGLLARVPACWPGVEGDDVFARSVDLEPLAVAPDEALEVVRIEAGVPVGGRELTDSTIPAEAGQWVIDLSVSFTKGCYVGQELVARINSRGGNVPRPLRGLVVDGGQAPPVGSELRADDGAVVGHITSAAVSPRLGPVALAAVARAVEPGAAVEVVPVGGAPISAEVRALPLVS